MLDWADELFPGSSRVTYATEPEVPLSGSHPLPAVPNFARYTTIIDVEDDDDDDGWLNGSAGDQAKPNFDNETISPSFQCPATFILSESMLDLEHRLHPSASLSRAGSLTSSYRPSEAQARRMPFEVDLDETTSDFPLLIDDDLEPNAAGSSGSSLLARTQSTFPPLSAGAEHDLLDCALVI